MTETPPLLHNVRASVPVQVDHVLGKALDPVPADRYVTAQQFADALALAAEAKEEVVAKTGVSPFGTGRGTGRRRHHRGLADPATPHVGVIAVSVHRGAAVRQHELRPGAGVLSATASPRSC